MRTLQRRPICEEIDATRFNTSNHHEYDPYVIDPDDSTMVVIDNRWWDSLSDYARQLIRARLTGGLRIADVSVPHPVRQADDPRLNGVYQAYIDSFDYHVWYNADRGGTKGRDSETTTTIMIHLSDVTKKQLLAIFLKESTEEPLDLRRLIKHKLSNSNGRPYFVRLSATSGKNEKAIRPFYTADEIVSHLVSVCEFASREYYRDKDTYLVLIPWEERIDDRNEFRLFVFEHRMTGASPQHCFGLHHYSAEELEAIEEALALFELDQLPTNCVVDAWIDFEQRRCHLIELNVFGAHSGAGSSLFNWVTDYDVLHDRAPPELRYRAVIAF